MHCQLFFWKLYFATSAHYRICITRYFFCKLYFATLVHYSTCIASYFSVNYFVTSVHYSALIARYFSVNYFMTPVHYSTCIARYYSMNYFMTSVHYRTCITMYFSVNNLGHQFTTVDALPGVFRWSISWHRFITVPCIYSIRHPIHNPIFVTLFTLYDMPPCFKNIRNNWVTVPSQTLGFIEPITQKVHQAK